MYPAVQQAVRRHLYEMLKGRYRAHEAAIDRAAAFTPAQRDAEELMRLFQAVYEAGFEAAVDGYREQLKKMGYKVSVVQAKDGV